MIQSDGILLIMGGEYMVRKQIFIILVTLMLCIMGSSVYAQETLGWDNQARKGVVTIIPLKNVVIHSYQAPEDGLFVNTQIIETKNKLVVVDTQFIRNYAKEVRAYCNSLGKPIERVIISHTHPDHWFGNEYFTDVPIYALGEVIKEIDAQGDSMIAKKRQKLGDLVTDKKVIPTKELEESTIIIDGVNFEFNILKDTEAETLLTITLPIQHVLIAQDLVYNRIHPFLGENNISGWISALHQIKQNSYDVVLVGHGFPGNAQVLEDMEKYLYEATFELSECKGSQEFKNQMIKKYPLYKGEGLLNVSGAMLYK